jgi:CRISPR-associated protein (TIGR03986 family)
MAELITGKLLFNQDKRKWQVEFFNEKKQQQSRMFCDVGEISADIPKNEAEQFDVQFERKPPHGEPIQIRLAGTDFIAPAGRRPTLPAPTAQRQGSAPSQRDDRDTQRERRETRQERTNDDMPREFHNPYNFVPAVPRDHVDGATNDLGDKLPAGHDRFHAELLSGKLRVQMTVKTPLLLPDTARVEVLDEHKTFPVRVGPDGKPEINPTAIKGMLRSAYEAVTNSRLSVFQSHDERLAFRGDVREGLFVIPARIENKKIIFYTGASEIEEEDGGPKIIQRADKSRRISETRQSQYAAWLEMYEIDAFVNVSGKNVFKISDHSITPNDDKGKLPVHPRKAWAWIEEFKDRRGRFTYWRVMGLAYKEESLGAMPAPSRDAISSSPQKVEGYICNTGKTMKGKHDERFFFGENTNFDIELEPQHIESWNRLIKNYRQEHEKNFDSPPKEGQGRNEYSLEWSRHIQTTEMNETSKSAELVFEKLKDGTLCHARVEWNRSKNNFDVVELYPVMISRHLYPKSPEKLLPFELRPARFITQLSPTDRVFGWVRQSRPNKDDETQQEKAIPEHLKKLGAYRGQIRIGAIDCISDKAETIEPFTQSVPLQILGQPKPQQGRFYVAEKQSGEAQTEKRNNEDAGYKKDRGLRGRKVYPHHNLPAGYWDNPNQQWEKPLLEKYFQEFRRPNGKDQRDKQNRSVKGWVKPETVFMFDIHFINLSKVELGALIWLLNLPKEHFHRFGGGKPLGFGSVELALDRSEVLNGNELRKRYFAIDEEDLDERPKLSESCVEAFEKEVIRAYNKAVANVDELTSEQIKESSQKISFIKAFLNSAKGIDDLPIHYPRARHDRNPAPVPPHVDGLAYEWFVENAKKPNRDNSQTQFVLPNLFDDDVEGLPILYHEPRGRR